MDIAAGICAERHSRGDVVTVAVDELVFAQPIRMADVVIIKARVNYTGHTSMEIGVRVERERTQTGQREHCLSGYFTFVGVDKAGQTREVPPVLPETDEDKRRFECGRQRREQRIGRRD